MRNACESEPARDDGTAILTGTDQALPQRYFA